MMRGPRKYLLLLILGSVALVFYHFSKEPLYHTQGYVFGTLVDISIYGEPEPRASKLANHVLQDFQSLHQRLHAWKNIRPNQPSELGALNAAFARGETSPISGELAAMLQNAYHLSAQSQALFNPAIGQLIELWGFQRDELSPVAIDDKKIRALLQANPSMADIALTQNTAYSRNPSVKLDLGGYAKGYALDKAAAYLRQQGVKNALVNIGGNIMALGQHGRKPWRVGIQHPRQPGAIAALDLPDGWAIGTSGDYQRYFLQNGSRYCHIIDPRNGYPVQHTQAVTVLIPPAPNAGVLSDVASKPIFIADAATKAQAAARLGITHFMIVDAQSKIYLTQKMAHKIEWLVPELKKDATIHIIEPN